VTANNAVGASPASTPSAPVTPARSASTTTLSLSSATVVYGHEQVETIKVVVGPDVPGTPTGSVTVKAGSVVLCTITLVAGQGSCPLGPTTLAAGSQTMTAAYAGDTTFDPSSAAHSLVVSKASSSTVLSLSAATITLGHEQLERFTVKVTPQFTGIPTGYVTIKSGSATLCYAKLASGSGSCTPAASALAVGTHTVDGVYGGDGNFNASTSPSKSLKVQA
jgi:large repetitive protein